MSPIRLIAQPFRNMPTSVTPCSPVLVLASPCPSVSVQAREAESIKDEG